MRLQKKSYSRVSLSDLLRRKRSNLKKFLTDTGIVTYGLLLARCDSMGVVPPSETEFLEAKGNPTTHEISSPSEGIVVVHSQIRDSSAPPEYSKKIEHEEHYLGDDAVLGTGVTSPEFDEENSNVAQEKSISFKKKKKNYKQEPH